jgi:hypothetical protein
MQKDHGIQYSYEHHISRLLDENNDEKLLKQIIQRIGYPTNKCCSHNPFCRANRGMSRNAQGFQTYQATLNHYILVDLKDDHERQRMIYDYIDEQFPTEANNDSDDSDDNLDQVSFRSASTSRSHQRRNNHYGYEMTSDAGSDTMSISTKGSMTASKASRASSIVPKMNNLSFSNAPREKPMVQPINTVQTKLAAHANANDVPVSDPPQQDGGFEAFLKFMAEHPDKTVAEFLSLVKK